MLQPSSSQGCDSDGEGTKSVKRRISFTPDVPESKSSTASFRMLCGCKFVLCYCSLSGSSLKTCIPYGIQYSVIPLTPVDCRPTVENKEVVKDLGRERESNSCLKRCSEVLGPSPPTAAVLDSNLIVGDSLERRPSFEGDMFCLTDEHYVNIMF